jgi:hypothetical protein
MPDYVCREVAPLPLAPNCRRYEVAKFESESKPNEVYSILRSPEDRWTCNCIGGKNGHQCKHPLFVQLLELHGLAGYMLESETMKVFDLFPVPKGRNGLLIEIRGDFT